ncbi:MAG: gamma carbonic anhydrase family protein [Gammaproteobacteria bacterium]|nr:gamma carbonic anhydrase family protein [Gammaproteobacteria bacterium]
MTIRRFGDKSPSVAAGAYVDETALVIGDVTVGRDASIWPMAVVRGDIHSISIGDGSNVQDGSVLHVTHDSRFSPGGHALIISDHVTVGHHVTLHGCHIGNHCLLGIGSVIMDGATVEPRTIVGAGSLVSPGKRLEGGYLWFGRPAKRARPLTSEEQAYLDYVAEHYVRLKQRHIHSASS